MSGQPEPSGEEILRYRLPATVEALPDLVEKVEAGVLAAGLPPDLALQLVLVLDEIVSNLASHATVAAGREVVVDVAILRHANRIEAIVLDDGPPFDMSSAAVPDLDTPLEDRPVGGLGLLIVRNVMDEVHYARQDGRNRLSLGKHLPP